MCAFQPSDSAWTLSPKQEQHISTLTTSEEVKSYLASLSVQQGLTEPDFFNPSILIPTAKADKARQQLTKTVIVNGVSHVLSASDEAGLLRQESDLLRTVLQAAPTQQTEQTPRDATTGRFTTTAEQLAAKTAKDQLALQFQLGKISLEDYVSQSDVVGDYLAKKGIDLDALADQTQARNDSVFQKSWSDSVAEFLASPAGQDWPGGNENLKIATKLMTENGLVDSPSAETLANVWAHMKQHGLAVENYEATAPKKINELYDEAAKRGTHPTSADILRAMGHNVSGVLGGR